MREKERERGREREWEREQDRGRDLQSNRIHGDAWPLFAGGHALREKEREREREREGKRGRESKIEVETFKVTEFMGTRGPCSPVGMSWL